MDNKYIIGYLNGLMNMASSIHNSPSYVKVDCYDKKSFKKEFCDFYKISEDDLNLLETNNSLETTLHDWFYNEDKIIESIIYWININIKGNKKVYLSDEKLVNILDSKRKDFYILDDLFFLECNNRIFVFLLGNNE